MCIKNKTRKWPTPHLHSIPPLPARPCFQVFYYIIMAVFGSIKGIVQLNLGSISTFQVGGLGGWGVWASGRGLVAGGPIQEEPAGPAVGSSQPSSKELGPRAVAHTHVVTPSLSLSSRRWWLGSTRLPSAGGMPALPPRARITCSSELAGWWELAEGEEQAALFPSLAAILLSCLPKAAH